MPKLTNKQFQEFKKHVHKWYKFFGLTEWDLSVEKGDVDDALATCTVHLENRGAWIRITDDLDSEDIPNKGIKDFALHEICELLLMEFFILAQQRYTTFEELDRAKHAVISRLVNALL